MRQEIRPDHNIHVLSCASGQAEIGTAPIESDLDHAVRHTNLAKLDAGQNPSVSPNQFVRNKSLVVSFQQNFPFVHQALFRNADLKLTDVSFLIIDTCLITFTSFNSSLDSLQNADICLFRVEFAMKIHTRIRLINSQRPHRQYPARVIHRSPK